MLSILNIIVVYCMLFILNDYSCLFLTVIIQRECAMMLLKRGADKTQSNFSGQTPSQVRYSGTIHFNYYYTLPLMWTWIQL